MVTEIVADDGMGAFGLVPRQGRPFNVFVDLARLQRTLGEGTKVNLLLATGGNDGLERALKRIVTAEDLGLRFRQGKGRLVVESSEFVLSAQLSKAVAQEAENLGATAQPVLTYLANSIRLVESEQGELVDTAMKVESDIENEANFADQGANQASPTEVPPDSPEVTGTSGREVVYSTVAALDWSSSGVRGGFRLLDGGPAEELQEGEIYLNGWAAADLGVGGDPAEVVLTYYHLGPRDELTTLAKRFRLRGVVSMDGQGGDPTLTPEFPGMADAGDMSQWDPPFPVDLARISPRDEEYWDLYRATPKAFLSLAQGRALWESRFGDTTSLRLVPPSGGSVEELEQALTLALPRRLGPAAFGLTFRPVRELGLAAATGATDFSGLFLAFSQFLIAAAALLVGLLFRLSIEQRAKEIGLLRALGFRVRSIRGRFLAEGGVVAMGGALVGLAAAVAYAAMMLAGLRGRWQSAVGTSSLYGR